MNIAVLGAGRVGLVVGACLAETGNRVVAFDVDRGKTARLQQGRLPIHEPGLQELAQRGVTAGRLRYSPHLAEALEGAEIAFVAVGTPSHEDGAADRRHVIAAAQAIAAAIAGPIIVAIKSTVPVGTCDRVGQVLAEVLRQRGVSTTGVAVVSNPEFLKEGRAVKDFRLPDRIVLGSDDPSALETMRTLYAPFVRNGHPILEMSARSAEMAKYAANALLAVRISLINELALICEGVGADIEAVRHAAGSDGRIGMGFLHPGIGYGGSCFPKDLRALSRMAREVGCQAQIIEAVEGVNRAQQTLLAARLVAHFGGDVRGRTIALWGLAFKPHTDDIREAPALVLLRRLCDAGANVCAHDPEALDNAREALRAEPGVAFAADPYQALEGADALVLTTEWEAFRSPDFARMLHLMRQPVIFDGRNLYDPAAMTAMGFVYQGIGRGNAERHMEGRR